MTTPLSSPELARAAEHLRAGQRDAAGRLLKAYLADHPRDADAWWLMAQAVRQPENVRTCLERVLRLRPDDVRARARLAQLDPPDEPDDAFFAIRPSAPTPSRPRRLLPLPTPRPRSIPRSTSARRSILSRASTRPQTHLPRCAGSSLEPALSRDGGRAWASSASVCRRRPSARRAAAGCPASRSR